MGDHSFLGGWPGLWGTRAPWRWPGCPPPTAAGRVSGRGWKGARVRYSSLGRGDLAEGTPSGACGFNSNHSGPVVPDTGPSKRATVSVSEQVQRKRSSSPWGKGPPGPGPVVPCGGLWPAQAPWAVPLAADTRGQRAGGPCSRSNPPKPPTCVPDVWSPPAARGARGGEPLTRGAGAGTAEPDRGGTPCYLENPTPPRWDAPWEP